MQKLAKLVNTVVQNDCLDFLQSLPGNSIDLAIADPPYNLNKGPWDSFKDEASFREFSKRWIEALLPALKPTASFYIFNTPYHCAYLLQVCKERDCVFQNWITWHKKDAFASSKKRYASYQETILFFTKTDDYKFNHDDIRVPYRSEQRISHAKKKGIVKNGKRWYPNGKGRLCDDVWEFSSQRHVEKVNGRLVKQDHPTIKPTMLIDRMVKASSSPGDVVLDLFCGTGTTSMVCAQTGRRFIACDNDEHYCSITRDRLGKAHNESQS